MDEIFHTVYEGSYVHAKQLFVMDMILVVGVLVAAAAGIFYLFYSPTIEKYIDINVGIKTISGETNIISGDDVSLDIEIKNKSKVDIENASVVVDAPGGFIFGTGSGEFRPLARTFEINEIKSNSTKTINVNGKFFADPRQKEKFVFRMSYIQKGTDKMETKLGTKEIIVVGPAFEVVSTQLPSIIFLNAVIPVTYKIKALRDIPQGIFNLKINSEAKLADSKIEGFAAGAEIKAGEIINIAGKIVIKDNALADKHTNLMIMPVLIVNKKSIEQPFEEINAVVKNPNLTIAALGALPDEFKTGVDYAIKFSAQNGEYALKKININFNFENNIIKLGSKNWQINDLVARELTNAFVTINIPKGYAESVGGILNSEAHVSYSIEYLGAEYEVQNIPVKLFEKNIFTEPKFTAEAIYFNQFGDQLGRGPLPPVVGKTTKYWVHWLLAAGSREIKNITIEATTPSYAEPTNKMSVTQGQSPVWDYKTKKITWSGTNVAASTDVDIYFEVAVTPQEIHKGLELPITGAAVVNINFENENLRLNAPGITTNLQNDSIGNDMGTRVMEE